MTQARWLCPTCKRSEVADAAASPVCHLPMDCLGPLFPTGKDPEAIPVALLEVYTEPVPDDAAHWTDRREVWFLKPGRDQGERIGWLGKASLSWRFLMTPGIAETRRQGHALTKLSALSKMLAELDR